MCCVRLCDCRCELSAAARGDGMIHRPLVSSCVPSRLLYARTVCVCRWSGLPLPAYLASLVPHLSTQPSTRAVHSVPLYSVLDAVLTVERSSGASDQRPHLSHFALY